MEAIGSRSAGIDIGKAVLTGRSTGVSSASDRAQRRTVRVQGDHGTRTRREARTTTAQLLALRDWLVTCLPPGRY
jgi:hypothetical protein